MNHKNQVLHEHPPIKHAPYFKIKGNTQGEISLYLDSHARSKVEQTLEKDAPPQKYPPASKKGKWN